jgi:acyl dehydratase
VAIDPAAVGATTPAGRCAWTKDDSLLYALGVGAGQDELAFTTENSKGVEQQAYPTQAVVIGPVEREALDPLGPYDRRMTVHGTQRVELHRPLTPAGSAFIETEIVAVHDKGKGALIELATRAEDADGRSLFTSVTGLYVRGAGGFGATAGPLTARNPLPERAPDLSIDVPTDASQALLYRLTGDRNPLHSDPTFASLVGYDRPIMHGLCTYGIAGRVLLHALCDGQASRVGAISGRFSAPVTPGDTLTLRAWHLGSGRTGFAVFDHESRPVLTEGLFEWA